MAQLTVQNVAIPDTTSGARLMQQAYSGIGDALGGVGDFADDLRRNQLSRNDADLVKRIAATRNEAEFDAMLDSVNLRHNSDGLREAVLNGRSAVLGYGQQRANTALTGARTGLVGAQTAAVYGGERRAQGNYDWNDNQRREQGQLAGRHAANRIGAYAGPGKEASVEGVNFRAAEESYGLPAGYLSRTAQIESSGNPNAKNPNSTASGLFQFLSGTAKEYGLNNPFDPVASTDAAARLARDNASTLRRTLGRDPTAGELYLAHQQGGGGAAKLLRNPNALARDIVGIDAVRLNGGSADMTAGEFANIWVSKFGKGGGTPSNSTTMPDAGNGYDVASGFSGTRDNIFEGSQFQSFDIVDRVIDGNFDAYTEGDTYRRAQRADQFQFDQTLDAQLAAEEQARRDSAFESMILDDMRAGGDPEATRLRIANTPGVTSADITRMNEIIDSASGAITNPAVPAGSSLTPTQQGAVAAAEQRAAAEAATNYGEIAKDIAADPKYSDQPALYVMDKVEGLGLDPTRVASRIKQLQEQAAREGINLTEYDSAVILEKTADRERGVFGFLNGSSQPLDGVGRNEMNISVDRGMEIARQYFTDGAQTSNASAAAIRNAQLAEMETARTRLDELNQREAAFAQRGQPIPAQVTEQKQALLSTIERLTTTLNPQTARPNVNSTSGESNLPTISSEGVSINGQPLTEQTFNQLPPEQQQQVRQTQEAANAASNYASRVNRSAMGILQDPNAPVDQKLAMAETVLLNLEMDRNVPPQEKQRIKAGLEALLGQRLN